MNLGAGSGIGNEGSSAEQGTLGCFAIVRATGETVMLSCEHVIHYGQPKLPTRIGSPTAGSCRSTSVTNVVGVASEPGFRGLIDQNGLTAFIDCAIAHLAPGVNAVNRVAGVSGKERGTGRDISGWIAGHAIVEQGEPVIVASHKGPIHGTCTRRNLNVGFPGETVIHTRQFEITTVPGEAQDIIFGSGDSGAVVLNQHNEVVGIFNARPISEGGELAETNKLYACHIPLVLDKLGLEIPSAVPANPQAATPLLPVPASGEHEDPSLARLDAIERRLRATPLGTAIAEAVLLHSREASALVHHRRHVKLAWYRCHGPAWLAHAMKVAGDDDPRLPEEVQGVTRRALLERMRDVLAQHGSDGLRAQIELHAPTVLELSDAQSLDEAFERLHAIA